MMMKYATLLSKLLILFLVVGIVSCKEDDGKDDTPASRILGVWTFSDVETDVTINGENYVTYIQGLDNLSDTEKEGLIMGIQSGLESSLGELSIETGSTIEFKSGSNYEAKTPGEDPENGTYSLSTDGKTLTINPGTSDELELDVVTLTDSNLSLSGRKTVEDFDYDLDEDGTNEEFLVTIQLNLTK